MAFSREFLEEVKQRNNIEEVVGRVVSLKRAGGSCRTVPVPQRAYPVVYRFSRNIKLLLLRLRCGRRCRDIRYADRKP